MSECPAVGKASEVFRPVGTRVNLAVKATCTHLVATGTPTQIPNRAHFRKMLTPLNRMARNGKG